jgi:hypothetical protein
LQSGFRLYLSRTVNSVVSDASGNTTACSFTVTVTDTQNPSIACPANITVSTPTQCGVVNYPAPTASDNCPLPPNAVVCSPPSGFCFPIGTTTVTCVVTDASGNQASCTFTVETCAGSVSCPANITRNNDPNRCGAVVNYPAPPTGGNCGTVSCLPASGSFFPKGTTTVTCTNQDGRSCSFTITVNDAQLPSITCPANITVGTSQGQCQAAVGFTATATDNCPGVTVTCAPSSGSVFPAGTTTVNCTARDASNNMRSCSFTVTVRDTQPPTITCPVTAITAVGPANCPPSTGAVVTFGNPTANDNCSGVTIVCSPASGSVFPVGTTTVTCRATDIGGNMATCSFPVTVFSVCLQDDANPSMKLLINHQTGQYRFVCNGTTYTGTATINGAGCTFTLDHLTSTHRVRAAYSLSTKSGNASIQSPPGTVRCDLRDTNMSNNNCNSTN